MSVMTSSARRSTSHRLPLAFTLPAVVIAAIVAEAITHSSTGYLRADVLVLVVVFAEASRRTIPIVAVVAALGTVVVQSGLDSVSLMRLAIAVALEVAVRLVVTVLP